MGGGKAPFHPLPDSCPGAMSDRMVLHWSTGDLGTLYTSVLTLIFNQHCPGLQGKICQNVTGFQMKCKYWTFWNLLMAFYSFPASELYEWDTVEMKVSDSWQQEQSSLHLWREHQSQNDLDCERLLRSSSPPVHLPQTQLLNGQRQKCNLFRSPLIGEGRQAVPFPLSSVQTIIAILACALPLSAFALEFKSCVCFIKGSPVWASEIHMHSPTVWVFSFLPGAQITHCNMINEWDCVTLFIVYSFYSALPPYVINSWSSCSV